MKTARSSLLVALFVFSGAVGLAESPAQAQTRAITGAYSKTVVVPYYQIQVEYLVTSKSYYGYGYRYSYVWITVAESENLAEAEFIYELYLLAQTQGVLDEVAPHYGYSYNRTYYPVGVRMITEYRSVPLEYSATLR